MIEVALLEINQMFSSISNYRIGEFFFLGKLLHFFIPMLLTIILAKRGVKFSTIFAIIFLIGLSKEIYDLTAINSSIFDSVQDLILDVSYPLLYKCITSLKEKTNSPAISKQKSKRVYSLYLKSENANRNKDKYFQD
ncbi:MAG: hypothetical protein H7177_08480 [Rhizobacter sp.]|nr:hypothetical protein [Bacteriovorax sp.]